MINDERYRVGIDVGGTNTDAVLISNDASRSPDDHGIISFLKTRTTAVVTQGIEHALRHVILDGNIHPAQITAVTIGTTHFLNAVVERDFSRLEPVAVIRLCSVYTTDTPPFSDFPPALKAIMAGYYAFCKGGCNIDGSEIESIDSNEIRAEALKIKTLRLRNIVIVGIYSPVDEAHKQEQRARKLVQAVWPEATVSCSRDVGNIGLLERENAAILNASIMHFARKTIGEFYSVMTRLNLTCPLYLTQNNGTIISAGAAREFPIKTFSSGATNSMRGAAYLCQRYLTGETIVLDIGGTTCDAGILLSSGLPKEASVYSTIAGVRINYTMPLLTSIGLGGGSVVRVKNGEVQIGPDSVGHALSSRGMAFGGDILTVTDIAICTGALDLSNTSVLAPLDETVVLRAQSKIATMLGKVVSEIKCTPAPVTVLMVGGGAVIAPDQISGVREIIRPLYHDIANAVGAAIAKVSGQVDVIETIGDRKLSTMIADCTERARQNCIRCGGDASTIVVADLQTMPIQYTTDQIRIIVTCVADLLEVTQSTSSAQFLPEDPPELYQPNSIVQSPEVLSSAIACCTDSSPDLTCYRPFIDTRRQWILSEIDLKLIAAGCYLLGCAGGGSPYSEYLQLRNMVRDGHICRVVDIDYLHPEDRVIYGGHMGSPAVSTERLSANEFLDAVHELLQYMRIDEYAAVMGLEIGGGNGLQPFLVGSSKNLNVPCLDADWMGRAFPTYYQTTLCVYNTRQLAPAAIASGNGQSLILTKANDDKIVDIALRAACSEMGSRVGMAAKPVSGQTVTKYAVKNTVSLAWRIGRVMHECRRTGIVSCIAEKIIEQIGGPQTAKKLYCGRITEVETRLVKAHSYGSLTIAPLGETHDYESSPPLANDGVLRIPYKNENILAEYESPLGRKEILASVPDLICVVDATSGENLGVPEYRYGLRVIVLAITASPRWTDTPEGLALGGPAAFGYDIPYKPIGVYVEPRSIIEEYGPASEIGKGAGA